MLPCFRQLTAKVRRSTAKPMPFLSYRSGKGGTMSETTSSRNINWEYRNGPRLGNVSLRKMGHIWQRAVPRGHHGVVFDSQLENVYALKTCGPVDVTLGVW